MQSESELKKLFVKRALLLNKQNSACKKIQIGHDSGDFQQKAYTIDTYMQSTHFPKGMAMRDIGTKAVLASASDLIAAGSEPEAVLISIMLPETIKKKDALELFQGIEMACKKLGMGIIGGDTKKATEIGLAICCIGKLHALMVTRNTAKPGDIIYASGSVGRAALGLKLMLGNKVPKLEKAFLEQCRKAFLEPQADRRYSSLIAKFATSACDVSDGFFFSLRLLAPNNAINVSNLPVPEELKPLGISQIEKLLSIGEDYCCIFSVSCNDENELLKTAGDKGLKLIKIGEVLKKKGKIEVEWNNKKIRINEPAGYDAFSASSAMFRV